MIASLFSLLVLQMRLVKMENRYNEENVRE